MFQTDFLSLGKKVSFSKELSTKVLRELCSEARQRIWKNEPNHVFIINGIEFKKSTKKTTATAFDSTSGSSSNNITTSNLVTNFNPSSLSSSSSTSLTSVVSTSLSSSSSASITNSNVSQHQTVGHFANVNNAHQQQPSPNQAYYNQTPAVFANQITYNTMPASSDNNYHNHNSASQYNVGVHNNNHFSMTYDPNDPMITSFQRNNAVTTAKNFNPDFDDENTSEFQ